MATRSVIAKRSSSKGGSFERKIGKLLSMWWWGEPDVLIRGAGSGSVATKRMIKKQSTLLRGEFIQIDLFEDPFPFWPELTHRKDHLSLGSLMKFPKHIFWQKWKQALRSCHNIAAPMVIFLEDRKPPIVSIPMLLMSPEIEEISTILKPPVSQGLPVLAVSLLEDFLRQPKLVAQPAIDWAGQRK